MKQQTLTGFERYGKATRRAQFLSQMERIVPWSELVAVVEPFYPKVGEAGGGPPIPLERMLRVYFLQLWFNSHHCARRRLHPDRRGIDGAAALRTWLRTAHRQGRHTSSVSEGHDMSMQHILP